MFTEWPESGQSLSVIVFVDVSFGVSSELFTRLILFDGGDKGRELDTELSTHHIAVQSKWTINHLLGLKAMESANSMPFIHFLNSGQTKAEPA